MNLTSHCCLLVVLGGFVIPAQAAEFPATVIGAPDRLIVSSPFDQDHPKTRKKPLLDWKAGIGVWWISDGALHGDELDEDKHASSLTYHLDATHLIIQGEFRLGTATQIAFGCRDDIKPHHHLARTFVTRDGIRITHMSGIAKTTKSIKIAELKTPLDPDAWHSITIEIIGDRYRVQVDEQVVEAQHSRFADKKGIVALISKGQGAQFKNMTLWHAKPKN